MSAPYTDLAFPDRDGRLRLATVPSAGMNDAVGALRIDPDDIGWPGLPGPLTLAPDDAVYPSPWDAAREVRMCFLLDPSGGPSAACSRSVLARALDVARSVGYDVIAAAELELHLLDDETGAPVYETIQNYGIVAGAPYDHVMGEVRALRRSGVPVMATNPEYGGGQFEINLRHGPAMGAADAVAMLRTWTGVAAARHGLRATFVSKPWPEASGSGMHVHQSLWHGGDNAFWDAGDLSAAGRSYLSGLLAAMAELAPLGSPTARCYTRRADGSFCPVNVSWGGDNRTVAVRVLAEAEATTRVEQRDAAADANPYLTMAGHVHAGMYGIRERLTPPEATVGNAYHRTGLPELPRTLAEALSLFERSDLAREVLGDEAHAVLCAILRDEAEAGLAGVAAAPHADGAW
jgi:glutamine synthetase